MSTDLCEQIVFWNLSSLVNSVGLSDFRLGNGKKAGSTKSAVSEAALVNP